MTNFIESGIYTSRRDPKPRAIPNFAITPDVLRSMSPIHQIVAKELIRKGRWHLAENEGVVSGPGTHTHGTDAMERSSNVTGRYIDG